MDLKPYGAFAEHTLRPLIEEFTALLKELGRYDLVPTRDIPKILRGFFKLELVRMIFDAVKTVICTAIIGYVAWTISQL